MSITEAGVEPVEVTREPMLGDEAVPLEMPRWRVTEGVGVLTLHLAGEFRPDRDVRRLIRTVDPLVRDEEGIRGVLVDASDLGEVPPALLYTVRVLDREARILHKTVDIHPAA